MLEYVVKETGLSSELPTDIIPFDSRFDPSSYLAFGDDHIDNVVTSHCLEVRIKASFQQGVSVFLGATWRDVYPVATILSYMELRGHDSGPFFQFFNGIGLWCGRLWTAPDAALPFTRPIASVSVQLPPWLSVGSRTL